MRPAHRPDDPLLGWSMGRQAAPPEETFNTLATGDAFSCGVRSDQTVVLLGRELGRAGRATRRGILHRDSGLGAHLRDTHRPNHRLLGKQ